MPEFRDLAGKRYGRLLVVSPVFSPGSKTKWLCRCDCGGEKYIMTDSLTLGRTKSCGCYRSERNLEGRTPRPIVEMFYQNILPVTESGCWLWTGHVSVLGYGAIYHKGKARKAHRISYEIHVGPIPNGLAIDHLCRVKCCVNPKHLEPVTHEENTRRAHEYRRSVKRMALN